MNDTIKVMLTGTSPLLMHNGATSDPLHPDTQYLAEAAKKRSKTMDDLLELAKREWECSIYRRNGYPHMPADNLHTCIYSAAKKFKEGPVFVGGGCRVANVQWCPGTNLPVTDMWAISQDEEDERTFVDRRSVRVGQSRVARTRCVFHEWTCAFDLLTGDEIDEDIIDRWFRTAGKVIGLGDYRLQKGGLHGAFTHVVE